MAGEHGGTGEAALEGIALVVPSAAEAEAARSLYARLVLPPVAAATSEAVPQAIPLVMISEAAAIEPIRAWYARIVVPRVVDYMIVAAFMFFWL